MLSVYMHASIIYLLWVKQKCLNSFLQHPAGFLLLDILTIFEPLNSDGEEGLGKVVI